MKDDVLHAIECDCQECLDQWENLDKQWEKPVEKSENKITKLNPLPKEVNERVFVFFLQERLNALEIEQREVKKVEEFNVLSAKLCAYNECLEVFYSLFQVRKKIKVKE